MVIAACDGDVADFAGAGTFKRRRENPGVSGVFSSVFTVPGANHNYFNTEWQTSDAGQQCDLGQTPLWDPNDPLTSGSEVQRRVGVATLSSFFRGFVGNDPSRTQCQRVFDPQYALPDQITQLVRPALDSHAHGASTETVTVARVSTSSEGVYLEDTVDQVANLSLGQIGADGRTITRMRWTEATPAHQVDVTLWEQGRDISDRWRFGFSLARFESCPNPLVCDQNPEPLDLSIQLLFADGTVSDQTVSLLDYARLTNNLNRLDPCPEGFVQYEQNPVFCVNAGLDEQSCVNRGLGYDRELGLCGANARLRHLLFQEISIELTDFGDVSLQNVQGLRFTFDRYPSADIYLDRTFRLLGH